MKRFTNVVVAIGFALAGSTAFAGQDKAKPVQMSDAQLDTIAAGQIQITDGLVNVTVGDVTVDIPVRVLNNSVNNNTVQIPVAANVNAVVAVLGNAAGFARQLGTQN
jgi:hypothetical protein